MLEATMKRTQAWPLRSARIKVGCAVLSVVLLMTTASVVMLLPSECLEVPVPSMGGTLSLRRWSGPSGVGMFDMLVRDQFGTSQSGPLFSESWPEPRFNLYRVDAITLAVVAGGGTLRLIRQAAGEPPSFLTPTSEELLQSSSWRYLGAMVRGPQGAFRFYSPDEIEECIPFMQSIPLPVRRGAQQPRGCPSVPDTALPSEGA